MTGICNRVWDMRHGSMIILPCSHIVISDHLFVLISMADTILRNGLSFGLVPLQHQDTGSIPRLAQWVKGSGIAAAAASGSDPCLRNSICHRAAKKEKKKKILTEISFPIQSLLPTSLYPSITLLFPFISRNRRLVEGERSWHSLEQRSKNFWSYVLNVY